MICAFCRSSSWDLEAAAAAEQAVACWNILFLIFGYLLPTWTIYRNLEKISHQNILSFKMGSALAPRDTNGPIHYAQLQNWQIKQLRQQKQNRLLLAETSFLTNCRISLLEPCIEIWNFFLHYFWILAIEKIWNKSSFYCFSKVLLFLFIS
jgi:hypothetical protein